MRLAFDVRSEWQQLLGQLSWRQLSRHWLSDELRRSYHTFTATLAEIWRGIDVLWAWRALRRRALWVCPRVDPRHARRFGGMLLLCLFVASAMRMWRWDTWTATAAVPSSNAPAAIQAGAAPAPRPPQPSLTHRPAPEIPASDIPRPTIADELAQRKAALVQAQQACLARLAITEPYLSAKMKFDELDARVKALRSNDPNRDLPRLSVEWIQAKSDLQMIIDEAMKADPAVVRAQASIKQPKRLR